MILFQIECLNRCKQYMNLDMEDQLSSTSTMSQEELGVKLKTEICKFWARDDKCPYGSRCFFAHGDNDLQQKPVTKLYRTKPCQNYLNSFCKYGQRCQFSHSLVPAGTLSLKYWPQVDAIVVGAQKKKHRLPIFRQITSGIFHKLKGV